MMALDGYFSSTCIFVCLLSLIWDRLWFVQYPQSSMKWVSNFVFFVLGHSVLFEWVVQGLNLRPAD